MEPHKMPSWLHRLLQHEKIRFVLVGGVNTVVDFAILFTLVNLCSVPTFAANIVSTTAALSVSYVLNKKAVFGDADTSDIKQIALFVVVTLVGLWIVQGVVITLVSPLLQTLGGKNGSLFIAKLIATLFSLTWNYLWYSRVVFHRRKPSSK